MELELETPVSSDGSSMCTVHVQSMKPDSTGPGARARVVVASFAQQLIFTQP